MRLQLQLALLLLGPAMCACAQEMDLEVELLTRVSTDSNRIGDPVSARVLSPNSLRGDTVEGKVSDSRTGAKMGGKAVLSLAFDALRHGGETVPISTQVRTITNSKGQVNADEEGRVVRGTNNIPKALAGTGVGGLLGGLAGGRKGALIGAASGAIVSIVLIDIAADGPSVRLDPGSRLRLSATSRGGPDLASLSPVAAPSSEPAAVPPQRAATAGSAPAVPLVQSQSETPVPLSQSIAPSTAQQPDLVAVKADFVPGERTIFLDDFSDMAGDEPPPHWKARGGTAELRTGDGVRQLTLTAHAMEVTPNLKGLPGNFTMEAEIKFDGITGNGNSTDWNFMRKDGRPTLRLFVHRQVEATRFDLWAGNPDDPERVGHVQVSGDWTQPALVCLWVQNGRARLYLNSNRIVDVNQVQLEPIESVLMQIGVEGDTPGSAVGLRRVRFAESAPDFSKSILSSGRYVTHGIVFDSNSDRLKPESAAVIRMVARTFETNPSLKLLVEGHTDSTGDAAHNLDLSRRRAEAVKAVLTSQFGVAPDRITTAGLGASKPIDTNDTPTGRAQNRRVEFAKM